MAMIKPVINNVRFGSFFSMLMFRQLLFSIRFLLLSRVFLGGFRYFADDVHGLNQFIVSQNG